MSARSLLIQLRNFQGYCRRLPNLRFSERCFRTNQTAVKKEIVQNDKPITYSTSKAGQWKARYSISGEKYDDTPRIQGLIIVVSLTAFMVHFFILREENDLDDYMRYLETNIPVQIQEGQLRLEIEQRKKEGKSVDDLEKNLEEIKKKRESLI